MGQPYVTGEKFSLADVLPATAMFFATLGGIDLSGYKHIGAWMQKLGSREALKRAQSL